MHRITRPFRRSRRRPTRAEFWALARQVDDLRQQMEAHSTAMALGTRYATQSAPIPAQQGRVLSVVRWAP